MHRSGERSNDIPVFPNHELAATEFAAAPTARIAEKRMIVVMGVSMW